EIALGKFDLAALHLKRLLEKEPTADVDSDLVKIEAVEGLSSFLRLQTVRQWSTDPVFQEQTTKNVKTLLDRLTNALEKHLSDPRRIEKFIKNLDASTVEERQFALFQLKRSRERAVPYLVEALRTSVGESLHDRIVAAFGKLDADIV